MTAKSIKSALGLLQDDPDNQEAWGSLRQEVEGAHGMGRDDLASLLEAARRAYEVRREYEAVGRLLEIELVAARGTDRELPLLAERARVFDEELLDDTGAKVAYEALLALKPDDEGAAEALERAAAKRAKWRDLFDRYVQEARSGDPGFRSSLLVSAAEVVYRYGRDDGRAEPLERVVGLLREALGIDPKSRRAEMLLERVLREGGRWDEVAQALERFASEATQKDEKIAGWLRLARTFAKKLKSADRAAAAYERVLDVAPGQSEAAAFLSDYFTSREMWEHLVSLYEGQLSAGAFRSKEEEFGATLQVAMVNYRMRERPDAAEPWFEKARKLEPSHPGVLAFFREWCSARGETTRLAAVLGDAQRGMSDGPERGAIVGEIAKLAEEGANAQKAIEQWRSVLRQDPRSSDARAALKRLYRQTASWNALTDLLRQELDKLAQDDAAGRLPVLHEIAAVYRDEVKSDSALVTVLTQIVQLDAADLPAVRELARVYESLQRWRDLLTMQARQADLESEPGVKAELWRAIARRWLDQFSNVQNAVESYEKLRAVDPEDREATDRLRELYVKRRAYKPLYELLGQEAEAAGPGAARRELWMEMAKLAAERLEMGAQAIALHKRVLDEEPGSAAALDALEKQAERDKDFVTVADVLERRASLAEDAASRLAMLLKLGATYSDRLHDHAKAMNAWQRVLALQPGHAKALRVLRDSFVALGDYDGLTELYAQNEDWEGLVEVLSSAADKATDPDAKVDLSFRCAAVYIERLGAPERAFRSYERILSVRPDDARAASALAPLYERDEKWVRLPALYEILLGHAKDPDAKLELLEKLVRVAGHQLQDRPAAFAWARKAYELAPTREGAVQTFEDAARAAGTTAQWDGFVEAVTARLEALDSARPAAPVEKGKKGKKKREAADTGDAARRDEIRSLRAKLAEIYAREMGRTDDAVGVYRALIEEDETDDAAVQTLDRLLRETDRRDDLRWLFDLRIERANTAQKLDLLAEWAILEEEAFVAPDRAVALYRRMLQVVPQHGQALRALARLLRAQGDAAGAVEVIALDRDQREGAERAEREVELARLYADPLRRYVDALDACRRALELSPNDPGAIQVVEQLLTVGETRARAAAILERAYGETNAPKPQADVLEVLIATTAARDDRLRLYGHLADVHEHKLEDANAAFDVIVRATGEFPSDLPLWDRLTGLAVKTNRAPDLVAAMAAALPAEGPSGFSERVELDLAERAATLFEEKLEDVDRARPYLERMLARQPGNERAFNRLKQILTTREQWAELGALYERIVEVTPDAQRRADLLAEVAMVAEAITGDRPRAIGYYERILELDPLHEQAVNSLDGLYAAEERWDKLAQLLERRRQAKVGEERLDLDERLGTLLFDRLKDATGAMAYLERVLHERPSAVDARRLVEKILEVPELRARAAIVLEAVYANRDEVTDLVRVLEIHLEFATVHDERRDLLRRVAELRDERLRDDTGALDAFARLLPLDPDDASARERTLEIVRRLGAFEQAVGILTATAAAAGAPMPRAEILMDVARVCENDLSDTARAERVYRDVLQLAPEDRSIALPACRALEKIYARSDSRQLAEMLAIQVKLEDNAEARRELLGRLGELRESVLDDPRGATEAWRSRLDDDPTDAVALASLDRLYERTQTFPELVEVLRTRERQTDDRDARRALMVRIATLLADKLTDVDGAIVAFRAVVEEFGPDRASLGSLVLLYELANRWPDLVDTLEADLGLADSAFDKLGLLARLGDVRKAKLKDVSGAIEAYRQALAINPSHVPSRTALEALLEDSVGRREAAAILRPLYEADGLHEKLLRVLEIEAENADSASERLALIAQAVGVAEGPLGDAVRAFGYASRGLREAVGDPELPEWIERVERLAASTGHHAELVALLRSVVRDIVDPDRELGVTLRIADVARSPLADLALAREYYARALELRGDDRRALVALESLYEETADHRALLEIVKRRAESAESDAERKQLLFKEARLCDEKLGDAAAAITVYEQILEVALDADAVRALERLYAQAERWADMVALHERQIGAPGISNERKAALHHALGMVLEKHVGDVDRAFDEYEAALAIDPKHPQSVASLEVLMGQREHAARAASMLEPVYLARLDWRRVMATLEARLGVSQDPDERRTLLRRLSKLHEEQAEDYRAALDTTALLLAEDPTDETTWTELERLSRVANAPARLAEVLAAELEKITTDGPETARLAKRTGELFEGLKDVERALRYYRRAHAFDPQAKDGSFEAIDRLLRETSRPDERVRLYRDALEFKDGADERLAALHTIAAIQESELRDDTGAVDTYRSALEVDEADPHALEALSRLYARGERWRDLADLTRRRAEQSALPEDEAAFRMALANLLIHKLGEVPGGIDELQSVVELSPTSGRTPGAEAVVALEGLRRSQENKARIVDILRPIYEGADDWRNLVAVNEDRLVLATDDHERVAVLRETASLWEQRGGDRRRAFDAIQQAWTLDPEDGEARAELDRLAGLTSRWDDLAAAYETAIAKSDGLTKREVLSALAQLHDRKRDDPRRALDAWDRLFSLDETDLEPLDEMDALATLLSDWTSLVRVLTKKAELVPDDETRASTWRRIGEARRDMLDDVSGAIDAYERALELESDSTFTIDCLIALYEQKNEAERLVDLYRRRVELCGEDDASLKFQLLVDAATRYVNDLSSRREAIECLTLALAAADSDSSLREKRGEVLRRLDGLYTRERLWTDLLENLKLQVDAAPDDEARRKLQKRIAALYSVQLQDAQAALETYRGVLEAGFDEESVAAIRGIGESRDELRGDAADALEPVLRSAGRFADLAAVLELRLRVQTEAADRARTLRALGEVAETHLGDPTRAQDALIRALAEEPQDATLHEGIERLAAGLGAEGWSRYAAALDERANGIFDANVAADLFVRLGRISEEKVGDPSRAAKAYVAAVERMGDDAAVLRALDRLFVRLGDARGLADVLERRIAVEAEANVQADLLHRLAALQIENGERTRGLGTLRQALERVPDHGPSREALEKLLGDSALFEEAFEALEFVYRALGHTEELATLYARRIERAQTTADRNRARLDLARILEQTVGDRARAQRAVEDAITEDPSDDDALAELERLAADNGAWREAAEKLSEAVDRAKDLPAVTRMELYIRLATWSSGRLDDAGRAEAAYGKALAIEPENVDIIRALEDLLRKPGRERDLVEMLRRRARLETDRSTKEDLLREAKALAEGPVGDRALAEAVLRDLIAEDEANLWALKELTSLRTTAGDDVEVVKLLLLRSELSPDGVEALRLKHEAAKVLVDRVHDSGRAMTLYEEILDAEPTDAEGAAALRALYGQAGRDRDLARLLLRLVDVATAQSERAGLRLELARLHAERFKAPDDAIETLRAILDEDPAHADAVLRLSQLYEQTGRDAELADLLKSQLDVARDRGDVDAELRLLVRLGEVQENRLSDATAAQEAYEQVLEKHPTHRGALEAVTRIAEKREDWDRAAGALTKIVDSASTDEGVTWALRLAAAREKAGDAEGAEEALQRGLRFEPAHVELRNMLRQRWERSQKWAELAGLLVSDADLIAAANPGAAALAAEVAKNSLPPMRRSMASIPPGGSVPPPPAVPAPIADQVKLLRTAAEIHLTKRQSPSDAIPILERAAALTPQDRDLLLALGDAYKLADRGQDAAQVLEKVIASFGNRRTKELATYHHRLASALTQLGQKDVALAQLDMAFKIDPGSVSVLKDLGVLAFETNDLDRAQKTFRALLLQRLDGAAGISKGEVFYYLGEISVKQGDKAKAVQMFERAIENDPSLASARSKLAELKG